MICAKCGSEFFKTWRIGWSEWAYKHRQYGDWKYLYFCSWGCMRAYEKEIEAIEAARRQEKALERRKRMADHKPLDRDMVLKVKELSAQHKSVREIVEITGLGKTTIYRIKAGECDKLLEADAPAVAEEQLELYPIVDEEDTAAPEPQYIADAEPESAAEPEAAEEAFESEEQPPAKAIDVSVTHITKLSTQLLDLSVEGAYMTLDISGLVTDDGKCQSLELEAKCFIQIAQELAAIAQQYAEGV